VFSTRIYRWVRSHSSLRNAVHVLCTTLYCLVRRTEIERKDCCSIEVTTYCVFVGFRNCSETRSLISRHVYSDGFVHIGVQSAVHVGLYCEHFFPSVPSTHHSRYPSPLHSVIRDLKPSFSANPFHRSLPFLLQD